MTHLPPTMEYSPHPLAGSVVVRAGAQGVTITVRPTLGRTLRAMSSSMNLLTGGILIGWLIYSVANQRSWSSLWLPLILAAAGVIAGGVTAWVSRFPIVFEAGDDGLAMRWREVTEAHSYKVPRGQIQDLSARHARFQGHLLKRWGLVVSLSAGGEFVLYQGRRDELELISRTLREGLAIRQTLDTAMGIPQPAGCRYQRMRWGDGVALVIPPRGESVLIGVMTAACGVAAVVGYALIRWWTVDEILYDPTRARALAEVALVLVFAAMLWAILYNSMMKIRRRIVLLSTPTRFLAEEKGLAHPFCVEWPAEELRDLRVIGDAGGTGRLQAVPIRSSPLETAAGEPVEHLQWAVAVLNAARGGQGAPREPSPTDQTQA